MPTGGNFDDVLELLDEEGVRVVKTHGPLEADADLQEICVWVVQQQENGSDAAFTEMTSTMKNRGTGFHQDPLRSPDEPVRSPDDPRKWRLTVRKIETDHPGLVAGRPAMAIAIALIADGSGPDAPLKTLQWAQLVQLVDAPASV